MRIDKNVRAFLERETFWKIKCQKSTKILVSQKIESSGIYKV
jgi:hypothetical protein